MRYGLQRWAVFSYIMQYMVNIDAIGRKILHELSRDGRISNLELADRQALGIAGAGEQDRELLVAQARARAETEPPLLVKTLQIVQDLVLTFIGASAEHVRQMGD